MFRVLNWLQYFFMRPHRFAMKNNTRLVRGLYKFGLFRFIYNLVAYFALSPLRLVNAVWYDIVVYAVFCFKDAFLDIFDPHQRKWTEKRNFKYFFCWIFGFPYRLIHFVFLSVGRLFEGVLFTVVDVFVPTITMMHGTSETASLSISTPGEWIVGSGNYAGTGIYFTMSERVARHYAGDVHPVIIYSRVALGKNLNLSVVPPDVRSLVSHNGDQLTKWGKEHNVTSFEWWRKTGQWWEYCMLNAPIGSHVKSWRIRVLYIQDLKDKNIQRVWGGKAFWLSLIGG